VRILFDQGTPVPLRSALSSHEISTVFELGWSTFANGDLLEAAERDFELLITTDQHIRNQQNLAGRRLAILVLPTRPSIQRHVHEIAREIVAIKPGAYRELEWRD
jgi:hypothetical protein